MFSQPTDDIVINNNRRRIKSFKNKNKRKNKRKGSKKLLVQSPLTTITMSAWAENFTHAVTWQMKQQIAYWKSKATALQYENQLLHDIIRKNYLNNPHFDTSKVRNKPENVDETLSTDIDNDDNEDLEVSEEFIQFLMNNTKYKEDALRERERLKALNNTEQSLVKEMEAMPKKSTEDKQEVLKQLYGENWQKISALETSLQSQYINFCDQEKPQLWPNIPLNFNSK